MSNPSAISAQFVRIKTLADGTPRVELDIHGSLAEAVALFSEVGVTVAIARLNDKPEPVQEPEQELKGGPLAKLAGQWENDEQFRQFMRTYSSHTSPRDFVLDFCAIGSRRELDHNKRAEERFHILRKRFVSWQEAA